jgi:carbonic anhydrase
MCIDCVKLNRRQLFSVAAGGLAATTLLGVDGFRSAARAKTTVTPDEALAKLKTGNARFVNAPDLCVADLAKTRTAAASGQSPWAAVLTCADSRVTPELIFGGMTLGELFVCRNAGNIADLGAIGSIEYAVEHLGCPLVVVLGHERCGAVGAACEVVEKDAHLPGSIGPMVEQIVPVARDLRGKEGDYIDNVVRENAKRSALKVIHSPIVEELMHHKKVQVVYARYDLDTGGVEFLS